MTTAEPVTASRPAAAWAPLRVTVFRWLWLALLASNIGTWMQTVGAQWLLVDAPNAATLVALVQTASMLPIVVLALPSGALADTFDRRRLLLAVQVGQFVVGAVLAALTFADRMPPSLLLTLTFALGAGQALTLPAWQALIPELVPRRELASASALGAISMNLARAVGPAIAGVLIARAGVGWVFALNALSFLVFAAVLLWWRRPADEEDTMPERFGAAVRAGGRYVRHSFVVRRILLRAALFLVPGSALWALLPIVASRRLGMGASGYGLLLGALGVGAVAGALVLPRVRSRLTNNQLLFAAGIVFGAVLLIVGLVRRPVVVTLALIPAGVAWVTVLSSINATMQLWLPNWVRARGLSIYQIVFRRRPGLRRAGVGRARRSHDRRHSARRRRRADDPRRGDGALAAVARDRRREPRVGRLLARATPRDRGRTGRGSGAGHPPIPGPGGACRRLRRRDGGRTAVPHAHGRHALGPVPRGRVRRPLRRGLPGSLVG
jgi:MFS family permease